MTPAASLSFVCRGEESLSLPSLPLALLLPLLLSLGGILMSAAQAPRAALAAVQGWLLQPCCWKSCSSLGQPVLLGAARAGQGTSPTPSSSPSLPWQPAERSDRSPTRPWHRNEVVREELLPSGARVTLWADASPWG